MVYHVHVGRNPSLEEVLSADIAADDEDDLFERALNLAASRSGLPLADLQVIWLSGPFPGKPRVIRG